MGAGVRTQGVKGSGKRDWKGENLKGRENKRPTGALSLPFGLSPLHSRRKERRKSGSHLIFIKKQLHFPAKCGIIEKYATLSALFQGRIKEKEE